ncbi:MAG: hypothetical protein Q7S74_04945 [Nanoarchaeota archaeon]|nr:hypothetical protein [Nanoarchaeota archaeon]
MVENQSSYRHIDINTYDFDMAIELERILVKDSIPDECDENTLFRFYDINRNDLSAMVKGSPCLGGYLESCEVRDKENNGNIIWPIMDREANDKRRLVDVL